MRTEADITVIIASLSLPAGYNNYSYLGYNTGMSMTSSTYPSSSLTTYPTTVLDPLLQASSLASAASVQTTSGEGSGFYCEN